MEINGNEIMLRIFSTESYNYYLLRQWYSVSNENFKSSNLNETKMINAMGMQIYHVYLYWYEKYESDLQKNNILFTINQ